MTFRNLVGHILLPIVSLLTAFFGVFNVLFSDSSSTERIWSVLYIFLVYVILSRLAHWAWPTSRWIWIYWLIIPAVLLGGFYLVREFSALNFFGLSVLLAAVVGAVAGRELRPRR